jgi:hypothetical protein
MGYNPGIYGLRGSCQYGHGVGVVNYSLSGVGLLLEGYYVVVGYPV